MQRARRSLMFSRSLCSSLISLAATEHVTGHHEAAERSRQHAEEGYATLMHFLSDPKHSQHLTKEQLYEFAVGANELRKELDSLRGDLTARI